MQINRCPKCGGEPSVFIDEEDFVTIFVAIWCPDCGLDTGRCKTYDEAVAKWNEMTKGTNK